MLLNGGVKRWKKVLYEDNGYPDNYTPPEYFLAAIEKNKNLVVYSLWDCLCGAAKVGKEISIVLIFWCGYSALKTGILQPHALLGLVLALLIGTGIVFCGVKRRLNLSELVAGLKTTFLFISIGFALSPVLYKLTDTISTDTIHTMAMSSFFLHLLCSDYGLAAPIVSWQISLNAAIFSTVCLASRFENHLSAFSLLCLSVFCFFILPLSRPVLPHGILPSLVLGSIAIFLLSCISTSQAVLALLCLAAVQIACPLIFHGLQVDKQTIHGPWDEATPATESRNTAM